MNRIHTLSMRAAFLILGALSAGSAFAAPPKPIQLPGETVKLKPSNLPGFAIAQQKCAICHSADYIAYQPPGMTVTQWTGEMAKMQHVYGAPIDDQEIKLLGVYLAATYGDAKSVTAADRALTATAPIPLGAPASATAAGNQAAAGGATAGAIDVQALLNANACLGCHAVAQKIVGPAYHDVAAKYKADPNAVTRLQVSIKAGGSGKWGQVPMPPFAQLTDAQLKALAEFVMQQ
jgi:cytochrome c551/c552